MSENQRKRGRRGGAGSRKARPSSVRETPARYGRRAASKVLPKASRALTATVGKRGTLVLPAKVRKEMGLEEGSLVILSPTREGLLLQPAEAVPIEIYTPERIAEFLLTNTLDEEDYADAVQEVRRMGLDPEKIRHLKPWEPLPSAGAA